MTQAALSLGAYTARSLLASAQRCVNLYAETNPDDSPFPVTYYPTPGLVKFFTTPNGAPARLIYRDSHGWMYLIAAQNVYRLYVVGRTSNLVKIGEVNTVSGPMRATDNGASVIFVDGTSDGWIYARVETSTTTVTTDTSKAVDDDDEGSTTTVTTTDENGIITKVVTVIDTNGETVTTTVTVPAGTFYQIEQDGWYGSKTADTMDTYMIFGWPDNGEMYCTLAQSTTFDATYYAAKSGAPDPVQAIAVVHKEIWMLGTDTTEVWQDVGGENFPFSRIPGVFIQQGIAAVYSLAKANENVFWIGRGPQGNAMCYLGSNYQALPIAPPSVVYEWQKYPSIEDAIGFTYQMGSHVFYVVTFPSADKTWVYDILTQKWSEWAWADENGELHRHRAATYCFTGALHLVGDWQNGNVYILDPAAMDDAGDPIHRIRAFPHILEKEDNARQFYHEFTAAMEVGQTGISSPTSDTNDLGKPPVVNLRYSDDGGYTWGNKVQRPLGRVGEYRTNIQWQRLGHARDRVFELSWSSPVQTSLSGAFIRFQRGQT